jgi:PAS domain-containing protein
MGERVTQSGRADLARASRLKKALESGAPPAFVQSGNVQSGNGHPGNGQSGNLQTGNGTAPANGACSEQSCPLPPLLEPQRKNQHGAEIRLQFLEQMFQASPDGLSIADCSHRVLLANETFVRMFEYEAAEVVGQPLENLVVPPDRIAE